MGTAPVTVTLSLRLARCPSPLPRGVWGPPGLCSSALPSAGSGLCWKLRSSPQACRAESLGAARCPRPSRESVSRTGHIEKQRVHDPLRSRGLSRFSVLVRKRARLGPAQCSGAALLGTATLSPSCLSPQRPPGVAGGAPSHLLMCPAGVGAE